MVKISCPRCNFTKDIPEQRIPTGAKRVRCPRCGHQFEFKREQTNEENNGSTNGTPWERREKLGLWQGIKQTLKEVLFAPKEFFCPMPVGAGFKEPLAFGLLVGSIAGMFSLFCEFLFVAIGPIGHTSHIIGTLKFPTVFLALIFLCPLLVLINIILSSLVIHFLLFLVKGVGNGFEATFRVVSYSQATSVWNLIPFIGGPIAWVWRALVQFIGLKYVHNTSYVRVLIAFTIPFVLFLLIILGLFFFIIRAIGI